MKFINWKEKNNICSLYAAGWRTDNIAELVSEFYLSAIEETEQC